MMIVQRLNVTLRLLFRKMIRDNFNYGNAFIPITYLKDMLILNVILNGIKQFLLNSLSESWLQTQSAVILQCSIPLLGRFVF